VLLDMWMAYVPLAAPSECASQVMGDQAISDLGRLC
jgi:hypothetical protein